MTDLGPPGPTEPAVVDALGIAVGLPQRHIADYAAFPASDAHPVAVLPDCDPVELTGLFTRAVVARTAMLAVHAGVVAGPNGAIVIPGASGLGKSTLTASLVLAGMAYLSDEVAAFDTDTDDDADTNTDDDAAHRDQVAAFPRPLTLDHNSRRLLGMAPDATSAELAIRGATLGAIGPRRAAIAAVVLARRSGGPVAITSASKSDALARLIEQSFNHFARPEQNFRQLARIVRDADLVSIEYEHAPDLAAALVAEWG